ncbi:ATP-binding protein [Streptomyces sp. NBC_00878]|uniref:sensor histidine kinase n=1 Tax=Streptomyces sp. NBC_00878 TaxID=2975854 RepID=UPI00224DEF11|nr:ATP-binding protein [Streptomyces sp. NBC_00878]MCX4904759.1 HAMP domain-containing histidine kinase [Streptomyces sp. NBC_00878]
MSPRLPGGSSRSPAPRSRSPRSPSLWSPSLWGRSLRARLLLFIGVTLVAVCVAMALTVFFVQRAYLLGDLDQRVTNAAERSQGGVRVGPGIETDLAFLSEQGQAAGTIAARLDDGDVSAARVVRPGGEPRDLSAAQRAVLAGIPADGSLHTRTVPGLGTYRVTALSGSGHAVLTGLPMDDVQDMIRGLVVVEAVVAAVGLTAAGCVCAVVIRRQLRPLGRVAATAVEVSRSPLDRGEVAGLTRVPERDTDPGSEAGQVGAALNRMIDHVESSLAERRRGEERMRRFLADASHELRTPLASIAGYAELMNRGTGRIEPVLAWRQVSAESARMTGLVEDLLLLARLDEGRPLHSAEVDLAVLVAEAVWDARAAGDGHGWQLAPFPDAPALVVGDETRLRRVVANLLANARVHTPVGTTVVASVEATDEHCVIRVRDDGPGIPPALLPRVFERFTRADASRSRVSAQDGGSGLGLAIAEAITEAHGGRIGVASEPGRTEFTLTLPPAPAPSSSSSSASSPAPTASGAPSPSPTPSASASGAPRTGLALGACGSEQP